jgi:hypothetical protein
MDLSSLRAQLEALARPSLTMAANDAALPQALRDFLQTTPNQKLTLTPSGSGGIVLSGDVLTVAGPSADLWAIEAMHQVAVTLTQVSLSITDQGAGGVGPQFTLAAAGLLPVASGVTASVTVDTPAEPGEDWMIRLAAGTSGVTANQLVTLGAIGRLPFQLPAALGFLDRALTVLPDKFSLAFQPGDPGFYFYRFTVSAADARWTPLPGVLAFQGLDLDVIMTPHAMAALVVGHIVIGGVSMDIGIDVSNPDRLYVAIAPTGGGAFPGLAALAAWALGGQMSSRLGGGLGELGFSLKDIDLAIERVDAVVTVGPPAALTSLQIVSVLTIKGLVLTIVVTLPHLTINGSLRDPAGINVHDLLASFGLDAVPVPAALKLASLELSASITDAHYRLSAEVEKVWSIGPFDVTALQLSISYFGGPIEPGLEANFAGSLTIAESIDLDVWVDYLGADDGWVFTGRVSLEAESKDGGAIEDLKKKFNVAIPTPIVSLPLAELEISYATATGAFSFRVEGHLTVVTTPLAMVATIDLTKVATGGYDARFSGTLTVGSLVFSVIFDHTSSGVDSFIAVYTHRPGDPPSIGLKALVREIAPDVAEAIPGDIAIQLDGVKLVFVRKDGAGRFAFSLDLGLSLSLTGLPLVGAMLTPTSLAIEHLQFLYSNSVFTAEQARAVNALLPPQVAPLPAGGLVEGLGVAGTLRLENERLQIALGVPSAQAPPAMPMLAAAGVDVRGVASPTLTAGAPAQDRALLTTTRWFEVQKSVGPLSLARLGVQYKDNTLFLLLDAEFSLSGLALGLDGLGLGSALTKFEPQLHLDGLSIALKLGPVAINGGLLAVSAPPANVTDEYIGEVSIAIEPYLISGVAAYAKVSGDPSFFVFVEVDGEFGGPPAFFVTGFMGGFGYNWSLALPPSDEVDRFPFVAGLSNPSLFGTTTPSPLDVLNVLSGRGGHPAWVTPEAGENWIAAGIQFRSFELVLGRALVVVEFGKEFEIALLGLASVTLPQGAIAGTGAAGGKAAYAYAELQIEVVLKPDDGIFAATAFLTPNSFLLTRDCHLVGGFAFFLWFGNSPHDGDFVVTLGGYHPAFTPSVVSEGRQYRPQLAGESKRRDQGGRLFRPDADSGHGRRQPPGAVPVRRLAGLVDRGRQHHDPLEAILHHGLYRRQRRSFVPVGFAVHHGDDLGRAGREPSALGPPTGGVVYIDWSIISFSIPFGADSADSAGATLDWPGFQSLLPNPSSDAAKAKPALAAVADAGGDASAVLLTLSINGGLARTDSNGVWVVRGDELLLTTTCAVPVTSITFGAVNVELPESAPSRIDIRPMGAQGVTSVHTITIRAVDDDNALVDLSGWPTPVVQTANLPEALWGVPLGKDAQGKDAQPAPAAKLVAGLATGARFGPPPARAGASIGPIDPAALITPLDGGYMPLRPKVQQDPIGPPVADSGSILVIVNTVASAASVQAQQAQFAALSRFGAAPPTHAPLARLGQQAGTLFAQPPLRAA